jgi:hypothetical protein
MKKYLLALALGLALMVGGSRTASATTTTLLPNDNSLSWTITGAIVGLPNSQPVVTFKCTGVTEAAPFCDTGVGMLIVDFFANNTTQYTTRFDPQYVCGATFGKCTPVDAAADSATHAVSAGACTGGVGYSVTASFRAYFPASCAPCFGGLSPSFIVSYTATSGPC